ncbi:hypothetical protein Dimus_036129 [Dionaea muscipula]
MTEPVGLTDTDDATGSTTNNVATVTPTAAPATPAVVVQSDSTILNGCSHDRDRMLSRVNRDEDALGRRPSANSSYCTHNLACPCEECIRRSPSRHPVACRRDLSLCVCNIAEVAVPLHSLRALRGYSTSIAVALLHVSDSLRSIKPSVQLPLRITPRGDRQLAVALLQAMSASCVAIACRAPQRLSCSHAVSALVEDHVALSAHFHRSPAAPVFLIIVNPAARRRYRDQRSG